MEELLEWMELIEDVRQEKKVRHKLKDIIVIVFTRFFQCFLRKNGPVYIACY